MTKAKSQLRASLEDVIAQTANLESYFDVESAEDISIFVNDLIQNVFARVQKILKAEEKSVGETESAEIPLKLANEIQNLMSTLGSLLSQCMGIQKKLLSQSVQPQPGGLRPETIGNPILSAKFKSNYLAQNGPASVLWTTITHEFKDLGRLNQLKAMKRPFLVIRRRWIFDDAEQGGMENFEKVVKEIYGLTFGNMTPELYQRICQKKQPLVKSPDVAIVEGSRVLNTQLAGNRSEEIHSEENQNAIISSKAVGNGVEVLNGVGQTAEFIPLDLASLDIYLGLQSLAKKTPGGLLDEAGISFTVLEVDNKGQALIVNQEKGKLYFYDVKLKDLPQIANVRKFFSFKT